MNSPEHTLRIFPRPVDRERSSLLELTLREFLLDCQARRVAAGRWERRRLIPYPWTDRQGQPEDAQRQKQRSSMVFHGVASACDRSITAPRSGQAARLRRSQ